MQNEIVESTSTKVYLKALSGNLIPGSEKELKLDQDGSLFIELVSNFNSKKWEVSWYPESNSSSDYFARTNYSAKTWQNKEIYLVNRSLRSKFSGFLPRDFFSWLNSFALLTTKHQSLIDAKSKIPSFKFLCETFKCHSFEESEWIVIEFTFSKDTESKFPGLYKRTASTLEKTKLIIQICDTFFINDKILISNVGKTFQFRFPSNPRKNIFLNPKSLDIVVNLEIKSYGITFEIQDLLYKLKLKSTQNQDQLVGSFVSYGRKQFSGNFLYFIPTGVIDFFIPGNIDEYLSEALQLLVYGTQGKGGSHFQGTYSKIRNGQINKVDTYHEMFRKRFSLFGPDNAENDQSVYNFFSRWKAAILLDLRTN